MSPNLFKRDMDGSLIMDALREAGANPVAIPVDPRKLARKASYYQVEFRKGKVAVPTVVSIPEQEEEESWHRIQASCGASHTAHRNPVSLAETRF